MRHWVRTTGIAATTFVVGAAIGVAGVSYLALETQRSPSYGELAPPDPGARISAEAREGCRIIGLTYAEIDANPLPCLATYWSPERLKRSASLMTDWKRENGIDDCRGPEDGLCNLDYGDADVAPPFPTDEQWWREQALLRPDRVTSPGQGWDLYP